MKSFHVRLPVSVLADVTRVVRVFERGMRQNAPHTHTLTSVWWIWCFHIVSQLDRSTKKKKNETKQIRQVRSCFPRLLRSTAATQTPPPLSASARLPSLPLSLLQNSPFRRPDAPHSRRDGTVVSSAKFLLLSVSSPTFPSPASAINKQPCEAERLRERLRAHRAA